MPTLELSQSTLRWIEQPRPAWRGVLHRFAAPVSVVAGTWLVTTAPTLRSQLAIGAFAASMTVMFTVSAVVHHRRWPPHLTEILLRADHTAIYLAIAGSACAIALLGLDGWQRTVLLLWSLGFAAVGVFVEWLPFAPGRGFSNTMYLAMSWPTIALVPWLYENEGWATVVLLAVGGVFYTVGAIIVALRRPDPAPEVFGYHEVWHLLVVAAATAHYAMMWTLLR